MTTHYLYPDSDVSKGFQVFHFLHVDDKTGDDDYIYRWSYTGESNWVFDEYSLENVVGSTNEISDVKVCARFRSQLNGLPNPEVKFGLVADDVYYGAVDTTEIGHTTWSTYEASIGGPNWTENSLNGMNLRVYMRHNTYVNAVFMSECYLKYTTDEGGSLSSSCSCSSSCSSSRLSSSCSCSSSRSSFSSSAGMT